MKIIKSLLIFSFILFTFSFTFTTSSDFNEDLGRHIKLGEIITKTKQVPKTNLFSYTNPDFPFINHHWLSEVVFYLSSQSFGNNSLIILKTILIISSLLIVLYIGIKKAGYIPTLTTALLFSPLLINRLFIRPEMFGYLFFSILLYVLFFYEKNKRLLYAIPFILLLWINFHISFVFGIFITFIIFLSILSAKKKTIIHNPKLYIPFILAALFMLLNPNGISGLFYPFQIFKNYGYEIVENKNLFYLNNYGFYPHVKYFFFLTPIYLISILILLAKSKLKELVILIFFFILAIYQLRHFPFFVLAAILPISIAQKEIIFPIFNKIKRIKEYKYAIKIAYSILLIILFIIFSILFATNTYFKVFDINKRFGLGFNEDGKKASEFVKKHKLPKQIFNGFDNGGYLVYSLYPDYKVFVDNRPEAYPSKFFTEIYTPLQTNKELREKVFKEENINTVIFTYYDQTQWGKAFVEQMFEDNEFKLVYLDDYIIIFTKKTNISDLKNNQQYFENLIKKENNYIALLKYLTLFSSLKRQELSEKAFLKAEDLNPNSCTVKRIKYNWYSNSSLLFYQAKQIKKNSWYCF